MRDFPKEFLFGAATSAYQVEGNNSNSDWWEWEIKSGVKERSGRACRHYEFYKDDLELTKALNHNAHRFSVEWGRIENQKGNFNEEVINHYLDMAAILRKLGVEPIVTLHHFTNPLWVSKIGGWENPMTPKLFVKFAEKIVRALCDYVKYWVTINEPMVYAYYSYVSGLWPPQVRSFSRSKTVVNNLVAAHNACYKMIHSVYKSNDLSNPLVSISKHMQAFVPLKDNIRNRFGATLREKIFNLSLLEKLRDLRTIDYIGLNYYTRNLVDVRGFLIRNLLMDNGEESASKLKKNSLGWAVYPQGLSNILTQLKAYELPVFILENGISTDDDDLRWDFIYSHLKSAYRAMAQRVNLIGYIYWSLIDNFEWDKGFGHKFGLVEVDYSTYKRTIRESGKKFAGLCKSGMLS